ncbi:MAG: hypothetical protein HQK89_00900 [Nitrospirae bacterium]|nr:hypothetical protein [Nitrospirota bacterium]
MKRLAVIKRLVIFYEFFSRQFVGLLVLVMVGGLLLSACGKKEVKATPMEAKVANSAIEVIERIKDGYLKGNKEGMKKDMTNDGYISITTGMKSFDSADLVFVPNWVSIKETSPKDKSIMVNISWTGTWHKGRQSDSEKGLAVFVLKGEPPKLDEIDRDNPFVYPE